MSTNPSPLGFLRGPIIDKQGNASPEFARWIQNLHIRTEPSLDLQSQITSNTKIAGRTEGIGTTAQNLTSAGLLSDADKVAADGATFGRVNKTALTSNNVDLANAGVINKVLSNIADDATYAKTKATELANNVINQINSSYSDTSASSILSQSGTTATINVAAWTNQYGRGQVSYNSGSVTAPSNTSVGYVYLNDPTYAGGAVTYLFTTDYSTVFANPGNVMVGKITLSAGGGGTGGGGGGGTGNICFTPNVLIRTERGLRRIRDIQVGDYVETKLGMRSVREIIVRDYDGPVCTMGDGGVTPDHSFILGAFIAKAKELFKSLYHYIGKVHNLEIETEIEDERNYFL